MTTRTSDGALPQGAVGRYLYIPTQTPIGGQASSTDTDFHAKFSRFNLGVDTVTENGDKLTGFIEIDFFGNAWPTRSTRSTRSTICTAAPCGTPT